MFVVCFPSEFPLVSLESYVGYANGASHSIQKLSFVAWAIYDLNGDLVSLEGICIS